MDVEHWRATVRRTIRFQPRENVRLADLIEGDLPEPRDYVLVQILLCTVTRLLVAKQAIKIPLRQIAEGRGTSEGAGGPLKVHQWSCGLRLRCLRKPQPLSEVVERGRRVATINVPVGISGFRQAHGGKLVGGNTMASAKAAIAVVHELLLEHNAKLAAGGPNDASVGELPVPEIHHDQRVERQLLDALDQRAGRRHIA